MGKTFISIGIIFILIGCVLILLGKIPGIGRLPGDVVIKNEKFSFYFPLMTCLLISVILSVIMYFINNR